MKIVHVFSDVEFFTVSFTTVPILKEPASYENILLSHSFNHMLSISTAIGHLRKKAQSTKTSLSSTRSNPSQPTHYSISSKSIATGDTSMHDRSEPIDTHIRDTKFAISFPFARRNSLARGPRAAGFDIECII